MFAVVALVPEAPRNSSGYSALSRGPLASLAFVAPLLALYEAGVLWLGPQGVRNGADLWLRGLLDVLGFGQYFLLPGLTVAALLVWHHLSGEHWRLPPRVCCGMLLESAALALCLVMLAQAQGVLLPAIGVAPPDNAPHRVAATAEAGTREVGSFSRVVAFLGAGIYEEALFRLLLLPGTIVALGRLGLARRTSVLWAVALTSVLFALAHYIGPHGDSWQAYSFAFRTIAGAFFATLFVHRGFGVTAGAHAGYDILVGVC